MVPVPYVFNEAGFSVMQIPEKSYIAGNTPILYTVRTVLVPVPDNIF